jgi:TonB family protein
MKLPSLFSLVSMLLCLVLMPSKLLSQEITKPEFDPRYFEHLMRTIVGMRDKMPFHEKHIAMTFVQEYNMHVAQYPEEQQQIEEITRMVAKVHRITYEIEAQKMTRAFFATPIPTEENPSVSLEHSEEVFKVVEQMPHFPGCESEALATEDERYNCAQKKMLEYLYTNVRYPEAARNAGVQGRTVVQFIVERDGSITNVNCIRDIGYGACEEAVRVIESMNEMPEKWIPGKQQGIPVRVQYVIPVSFKL